MTTSRSVPATIGILGMLPTAAFGLFGFLTPYVIRWASLEKLIVALIVVGIVGQIARVMAPNTPLFLVFSVVAFGGLGAGNVLLPPLVKKYFPAKIGLMTALYVTAHLRWHGAAGPARRSPSPTPPAGSSPWPAWAGISTIALIPWLVALFSPRHDGEPGLAWPPRLPLWPGRPA